MQMSLGKFKEQLSLAASNIKNKFCDSFFPVYKMDQEKETYLLTLFGNKKLVKKLGKDFIIDLYNRQGGKCAITGIEMTGVKNPSIKHRNPTNMSIDKIDPKLGYIKGNIQLTCLWANTGKQQMTTEKYRKLLVDAYNSMMTPPTWEM